MRIELEQVHFSYPAGVEALRGVSLIIEPGEQVAIVGQNGAGKTTLVKHLNGLLKPSRGHVRIGDWLTGDYSVAKLAARVGYVFQNPDDQLFKSNVRAEVAFGPANLGFPPERVEALVQEALELLELANEVDTNPYDLPVTWRKRVSMAAVLAMDTPIVVLDEPTTGQDYRNIQRMAEVIHILRRQHKTVVAISHDIDFVAENFERIVVMGQGQILLDGPAAEILAQTEILHQTYVEPPQLTRLGHRLELDQLSYTPESFLAAYRRKVFRESV